MVSIRPLNGSLLVKTPYDPDFVADLKQLPAADRRFDPVSKAWLVTPDHGPEVAQLVLRHFGMSVDIPPTTVQTRVEARAVEIRYIGTCKDRGGGEPVAFGWSQGGWNVILPEAVLREWFGQQTKPGELLTLYAVLSVKQDADESDIRSAYRRLAKQWHPDTSREPDAAEQFRTIQHAYEVLRDPLMRRRYNAGLKLSSQTEARSENFISYQEYRSPLRCGLILAEGLAKLGKFSLTHILAWHDITDSQGRTLSTSWRAGADMFEEVWL